ncbi:MAG TPA: M1 family peptidase [Anaerolineae bacterium]|nr:M1 family peptidase [Anaerolineae bacterium]
MSGLHYGIQLEPDLKQFTFQGVTAVSLNDPAIITNNHVILNAHELEIEACTVNEIAADFVLDATQQTLTITLPPNSATPLRVELIYNGRINDQYAGLYRSRYQVDDETRYMASTQFQASDARRVFPCFDQPGAKATFDIELIIDAELTAVSTTPVQQETMMDNGQKRVQFERTPPMSTYLVFMGVGQFDTIQADTGSYQVRVLTAPGKGEYGRYALDIGQKSLQFCEEYTNIPYPLSKCDLIAVPDSIGAMENFGAIRHSEDVMLVYPGRTPFSTKVLIGQIIAHEVSHMWFGDLVTPADWKYLWLNESFATYFTFVIPNAIYPDWRIWHDFAADRMRVGLDRDGLLETVPIELPPGQALTGNPAPTPSNAPIVYNKGAAVLRMLAAYVGEAAFRRGLNHYLQTCQFQSIHSQQFWDAFGAVVPQDVSSFAEAWIYQPGFPLVTAVRRQNVLHLRQQRFTFSPNQSNTLWPIPIDLLLIDADGSSQVMSVVLDEEETAVSLPSHTQAYKLNHNQTGFYRVQYTSANLAALGRLIAAGQLNALDSFNVQNDLFALVRRGEVALADYLAFITDYFASETRYLPLLDAVQNLRALFTLLADQRPAIAKIGGTLCRSGLQQIGYLPQAGENHQQVRLRQELLWAGGLFGSDKVRQFGKEQFAAWIAGTDLPVDILPAILNLGAITHPDALKLLTERLQTNALPEAETNLILEALGQLPQPEQLQQALAFNWQRVGKSQQIHMIAAVAFNPTAARFMWDWLVAHQEQLEQLHPGQVAGTLVRLLPIVGLGRETAVHQFCQTLSAQKPFLQDSLTMALALMAVNGRLKRGNL